MTKKKKKSIQQQVSRICDMLMGQSILNKLSKQQFQFNFRAAFTAEIGILLKLKIGTH